MVDIHTALFHLFVSCHWSRTIRGDVFIIEATQVTEMLEANVTAPYKFRKVSVVEVWWMHGYPTHV